MVIAMVCTADIIPPMLAPKIPYGEKEESEMDTQDKAEDTIQIVINSRVRN